MAKQTTYQRLKAENIRLKKDIYNILRGEYMDKQCTIQKWEILFQLEDVVWMGDTREHIKKQSNGKNGTI